ncbi:MAG: hypothetical protein ABIX46_01540 [Burkholderiaceae bacterium]
MDPAAAPATWRPSLGYLALAVGIVSGGLAYGWLTASPPARLAEPPRSNAAPTATTASAVVVAASPVSVADAPVAVAPPTVAPSAVLAAPRISRTREPDADQTPDLTDYVNAGETPTMPEVIDRLHQAGVHGGLGAFSPPGTRPPRIGLAVPEDFALPEGYVRHHQATDDGQRIEAVLMFAPDARLFDAAGRPIALPADGIVPPELAPAGLPMRRITIPAPLDAGGRGR